jgi:hypothetical protein
MTPRTALAVIALTAAGSLLAGCPDKKDGASPSAESPAAASAEAAPAATPAAAPAASAPKKDEGGW